MYNLFTGDCLDVMKELPANSVDSIITDPPYGLSFMGKDWDHGVPGEAFWREAMRVAKPGAHLLAFGGTRTFHRLAVAIEDAGWEIRDCVMWVYGSGFPKSHDVSKAIDREAGASREVLSSYKREGRSAGILGNKVQIIREITAPATPAAKQWEGWGTALKPAWEPIIVARKPFTCTVAQNVQAWGTGAINVDGCRVGTEETTRHNSSSSSYMTGLIGEKQPVQDEYVTGSNLGRWPANFIHDGSDEVLALMPETPPSKRANRGKGIDGAIFKNRNGEIFGVRGIDDNGGSAARFFYCAKASKRDRDEGCEGLEERNWVQFQTGNGASGKPSSISEGRNTAYRNIHPTVKPTALMRYLCKLVTPPGGIILDPFMGSGSTGKGAVIEGFDFIGIDLSPEYVEIAKRRIEFANSYLVELQPELELVTNVP